MAGLLNNLQGVLGGAKSSVASVASSVDADGMGLPPRSAYVFYLFRLTTLSSRLRRFRDGSIARSP